MIGVRMKMTNKKIPKMSKKNGLKMTKKRWTQEDQKTNGPKMIEKDKTKNRKKKNG